MRWEAATGWSGVFCLGVSWPMLGCGPTLCLESGSLGVECPVQAVLV